MAMDNPGALGTFDLAPRGPDLSPHKIGLAAQASGVLVGAIVDGAVRTWLADVRGQLVLIVWPRGFRARFDPLELLDDRGRVVAMGGELVTVAGGFLKQGDARSLGHEHVFSAWQVSRKPDLP
jgi:hypothetical protein